MKTIKIFLASSEELKDERLEMTDLVSRLNQTFMGRGIQLELKRWEYLDSSMGDERKQDEYNKVLRECDICLVLFWRKFGSYTAEELDVAYQCHKNKVKPEKIYVFFKNPDDNDVTSELKEFIKSYENRYGGHFFNKFLNVDTLKLEFLLQFELYQKDQLGEKAIEVRNEHVYVDNEAMVDLNNIPFAANNEGFLKMQSELKELEEEIEKQRKELDEKNTALKLAKDQQANLPDVAGLQMFIDMAQKAINETEDSLQILLNRKNKLKDEFEREQQNLFNTARRITEQRGLNISERMARAIEAFESGDAKRADIILDEAEKNADQALSDIRIAKQVGLKSLEELILKASVKMANDSIPIDNRIVETQAIYEKAIKLAKEAGYDDNKYADLIDKYGDFLFEYGKYDEAIIYRKELLAVRTKLCGESSIDVAWALNKLGRNYDLLDNQDDSYKHLKEAEKIVVQSNNKDLICESEIYNNLGNILEDLKKYDDAIDYHKRSLTIRERIYGSESPEVARSLNNIGAVMSHMNKHEEALEYHINALKIKESTLGKFHRSTANSYNNIGCEYEYLNNYSEAIKSRKTAIEIYEKMLGRKHPDTIGCYYWIGDSFYSLDDFVSSVEWTLKAANLGSMNAQCDMGWFYKNGRGVEQNYIKAYEWYLKAAEQGNSKAQDNIGDLYYDGKGVEQDYKKAAEWYKKAAEQGSSSAQCSLGYLFEEGQGVNKDFAKAVEFYELSAKQDNHVAQCNLGYMYEIGKGVEQNYKKALEWYKKSAIQGYARAQYHLALLYRNGEGVKQNYKTAFNWFKKSADQNDSSAQCYIGWLYANGLGIKQDYKKAYEWYLKAAEQGDDVAQNNLGWMYANGCGTKQDYEKAIEWYKKSAEQNYKKAYNELAWHFHLTGKYDEALPWAEKAVDAFPENTNNIDTLACVCQDLGRYNEALEQFELCLKLQHEQNATEDDVHETEEKIASLKNLMKTNS